MTAKTFGQKELRKDYPVITGLGQPMSLKPQKENLIENERS